MEIMGIYDDMVIKSNKDYRKNNPKTDTKYRASSGGMCSRKIYFEAILKAKGTTPDVKSLRIMRLGTIVHEEIQSQIKSAFNKNIEE